MNRSGIILVDKPAGVTSADVVAHVKRSFRAAKVGHAGTLDPMATGLLVCLLNGATRLAQFAEDGVKQYSGVFRWGLTTTSDDITGAEISVTSLLPTYEEVREASLKFVGTIDQVPPKVSAIKVDGVRAYKLSRQNAEFELKARPVTVHSLELSPHTDTETRFVMTCSPGTYVRSVARDMGALLGCGGCLAELRREASFPFSVKDAVSMENIDISRILDWGVLFPRVPVVGVDDAGARRLLGGAKSDLHRVMEEAVRDNLVPASAKLVVYRLAKTGGSLGLIKREGDGWSFAANVG